MSTHPPTHKVSPGRVFLWRLSLALVLTSVATAVGLGGGSALLAHKFAQARSVPVKLDRELPGSMNILLLGSDTRAFVEDTGEQSSFGDAHKVSGQRADVVIILRVEAEARRAFLVSIPRDTYIRLPGYRSQVLINQSFQDGPQGVINAIKSNFDVPIHHYAEIDFNGFRAMVEAMGGVRMYIAAPSRDRPPAGSGTRGSGLDIKTAGCQTLNGTQALAWVRSRYFQYYEAGRWRSDPTSDIGRISRQQDFLRRLMAQAVEKGAFNPITGNRLADAAMANLTVDSSFDVKDALRIAQSFRPVGPAGVEMTALPTRPVGAHLAVSNAAEPVLARLRGDPVPAAFGEGRAMAPAANPPGAKARVGSAAAAKPGPTSAGNATPAPAPAPAPAKGSGPGSGPAPAPATARPPC